ANASMRVATGTALSVVGSLGVEPLLDLGEGHQPVAAEAAAIFVSDDAADMLVGDAALDAVVVLRGLGVGRGFEVAQTVSVGGDPTSLDQLDVDADGNHDVVYGTRSGEVGVLLNRGGTLVPTTRFTLAGEVVRVSADHTTGENQVIVITRAPGSV